MENKKFDAVQQAIQHYRDKNGYNYVFSKEIINNENPQDWDIEAVHSFIDKQNHPFRSHILYALKSKTRDLKGIIVRRFGTIAQPFKAHFLQQVELYKDLSLPPSVS
jgi:hypothetical protein